MLGSCTHVRWVYALYLIAGLVHLIPQLYSWLSGITGGTPWIQIIVGILVVVFSILGLFGKCCGCSMESGEGKK